MRLHFKRNSSLSTALETKKNNPAFNKAIKPITEKKKLEFTFPDLRHHQLSAIELWQAMNQIALEFIDRTGYDQGSHEVHEFLLSMYDHYGKQGLHI